MTSENSVPSARWATAVLFLTCLIGYLDRSVLTLLVKPVKASFHLSDGEMGLMLGVGFIVTFSLAGLFLGRMVDRINRRNLLIGAVAIWSLSSAACGLAQSGLELFIARMGVGVGEAAIYPVAVSIIADYFPPTKRGAPYGFFTMGVYSGQGLSLILAGALLPWATALSSHLAAQGHTVEPWRLIMFLLLAPGLLGCTVLATMREPVREFTRAAAAARDGSGFGDWVSRAGVLVPHHLFMALVTLALVALSSWMPTVLIREHGLETRSAGLLFGTVVAVTGVISVALSGLIADVASRRNHAVGPLLMALICIVVGLFGFIAMAFAPSTPVLMLGAVLAYSPLSMSLVAGIAAMADLSPSRSRGQITSIYFLFTGVIGTAGGPALVGYLNDLSGGTRAGRLGWVLSLTGGCAAVFALVLALLTIASVRRSMRVASA